MIKDAGFLRNFHQTNSGKAVRWCLDMHCILSKNVGDDDSCNKIDAFSNRKWLGARVVQYCCASQGFCIALQLCRLETRNQHSDGTRRLASKTSFKQHPPIDMLSVCSGILQTVATFFEEGGLSLSLCLSLHIPCKRLQHLLRCYFHRDLQPVGPSVKRGNAFPCKRHWLK